MHTTILYIKQNTVKTPKLYTEMAYKTTFSTYQPHFFTVTNISSCLNKELDKSLKNHFIQSNLSVLFRNKSINNLVNDNNIPISLLFLCVNKVRNTVKS